MLAIVRQFAGFVMRSRRNAFSMASGLALLSFLLPPVLGLVGGILSLLTFWLLGGIVGLVTLRLGIQEGAQVLAVVMAVLAGGVLLLYQSAAPLPLLLLSLVPIWILSNSLRTAASMWAMVRTAILLVVTLFATLYFSGYDMIQLHQEIAEPWTRPEFLVDATEQNIRLLQMTVLPTLAASFVLVLWIASVFLGRWWQAVLYNPGGFQQEFHHFRISKNMAIPFFLTLYFAISNTGSLQYFAVDISVLLLTMYWLGGIALIHGIAGMLRVHWGFFLLVYLLNLLPPMQLIIAGAGLFDSLFNFREQFRNRT